MNILLGTIQSLPAVGGVNTYIYQLEEGLKQRGHEVTIVSGNLINNLPKGSLLKIKQYEKIYYEKLGRTINKAHISNEVGIHALKEVIKNIDMSNVDLIHSQDGIISKIFNDIHPELPIVGTIHGCFYSEYLQMGLISNNMEVNLTSRYDKWAVGVPKQIITVSSYIDANLQKIPDEKRNIVFNGIETDLFHNKVQKTNKKKHLSIITSGSLLFYKGYDVLMNALAIVKEKGYSFEVNMFGEGPKQKDLENIVNKYNLPVYFKGKVSREKLAIELKKGDVFIQPSRLENFPYSVIEAMISGCAVICSNVGGMKDQITHRVNGLLFEKENHNDLAQQLIFLFENTQCMDIFTRLSANKVEKSFTTNSMLSATEQVYIKTLEGVI
jgi:L-malate glycosyltransferase